MANVRTGRRYRANRLADSYDVLIVGSGIGGLVNAALLSLLGQRVCVLEQHYTAGGYTHAYEREGYEWDVGVHYIGDVHKPSSTLRRIFDVVSEGRLQWAEMDAAYDRIILGEREYDLIAGTENFINGLVHRFPDEESAIRDYVALIRQTSYQSSRFFAGQAMPRSLGRAYGKSRSLLLDKHFFQTTREVLETLTGNQELIAVLTGQWGDYGLPPAESSFLMHALVAKHYLAGGAYPIGGASAMARSIIPTIQKSGGEVFTYAEVEQILIEHKRAVGVRMADGTEIRAGRVVSNAGFLPTVNRLLPESARALLPSQGKDKQIQLSSAHLCLYAGFKGTPSELGMTTTNLWIYPSEDHEGNLKAYLATPDEAPFPLVYVSFPSAKDPDWENRYPGKSTVEIVTVTQPEWFGEWQGTTWQQRGENYESKKRELSEKLLAILFRRMPQLEAALDFYELSTPLSTQFYQRNEQGEIYGLDHFPQRFDHPSLHPQTPIKDFYLTGADVVTAGIGGAVMGGMMTSSVMLGPVKARQMMKLLKSWQPSDELPA
ncbi:MAG TPA: FAD-dependent oxidoreductase [Spongiibacteraceae bacterium]|nr:FAD-dependent oxidoreductase [Spongiibacteraceae bacterium]HCS26300.1 FAD-dependent oxidoreductase [Spongiibacteraceae bacterium]